MVAKRLEKNGIAGRFDEPTDTRWIREDDTIWKSRGDTIWILNVRPKQSIMAPLFGLIAPRDKESEMGKSEDIAHHLLWLDQKLESYSKLHAEEIEEVRRSLSELKRFVLSLPEAKERIDAAKKNRDGK